MFCYLTLIGLCKLLQRIFCEFSINRQLCFLTSNGEAFVKPAALFSSANILPYFSFFFFYSVHLISKALVMIIGIFLRPLYLILSPLETFQHEIMDGLCSIAYYIGHFIV